MPVCKRITALAGVGVTLKRAKQVKADVLTLPRFARADAVRAVYGAPVATNLVAFSASENWSGDHSRDTSAALAAPVDTPAFSIDGLAATGNAAVRKSTLVLFINGRAAECAPLRAAVESAYVALHSKAATFWVFIDARVPPGHVDVNIHPTKTEVALLFQPELIEAARSALERVLEGAHNVRSFARSGPTQQPISGANSDDPSRLHMCNTLRMLHRFDIIQLRFASLIWTPSP